MKDLVGIKLNKYDLIKNHKKDILRGREINRLGEKNGGCVQ